MAVSPISTPHLGLVAPVAAECRHVSASLCEQAHSCAVCAGRKLQGYPLKSSIADDLAQSLGSGDDAVFQSGTIVIFLKAWEGGGSVSAVLQPVACVAYNEIFEGAC